MDKTVEIARRGQITIPKIMRDDLGIEEGQKYHLRALPGGVLILTPRRGRAIESLAQIRRALVKREASLEQMLTELRQIREANGA